MSLQDLEPRPISGKGLVSLLCALLALGSAVVNTRPVTEDGVALTLFLALLVPILAVLSLKDVWQKRVGPNSALLGLAGVAVALFAVYLALGCRAMQKADDRTVKFATNLKRVGLALTEYQKANGAFPPAATCDQDGKPLLSWRVLVLPFLEREGWAEPGLFEEFKLDEPWDGPRNRRLLKRMPEVFAPPDGVKTPEPDSTYFRVFVGPGAAFEGTHGLKLDDFPDGPGATILVVEAREAVPWTKPEDLPYAGDRPLPPLGILDSKYRFYAVFADGSLHTVRQKAGEQSVRALITRNGHNDPGQWEFTGVGPEDE